MQNSVVPGITVIGAGVIGVSIALHLAQRGVCVTVLDRAAPGAGATAASFAWINAAAFKDSTDYYRLRLQSMQEYHRLERDFGISVQRGGAIEWLDDAADLQAKCRANAALGYPVRMISSAEVAAMEPALNPLPVAAAAFAEIECTLDPAELMARMLARAKALGVRFESGAGDAQLIVHRKRVRGVRMAGREWTADTTVLAAGTGNAALVAQAGAALPMSARPGMLAHSKPLAPLLKGLVLSPRVHMKQNPDGRIVAGADFAGGPLSSDPEAAGRALLATAAALLKGKPALDLDRITSAVRPEPADGFPAVGRVAGHGNLYLASMHSGITLAPLIGRLAASEIIDGIDAAQLSPFRPDRFG